MLLSSLTEASGSRILLEALAAGCSPIVFKECRTAAEILNYYKVGHVVSSKFKLNMPSKTVSVPFFSYKYLANQFEYILQAKPRPFSDDSSEFIESYSYNKEVAHISAILKSLLTDYV